MSNQFNDLSSDHGVDNSLHTSSGGGDRGNIRGQTFSNPSGHSFSPQQGRQLQTSSRQLTPTGTTTRRGGCCLFNLGCLLSLFLFVVPFGVGITATLFEDESFREQVSDIVSEFVCPNRSTLVFERDSRANFFEDVEAVQVLCETPSGRISEDLTEEARNFASLAVVLVGGYVVLVVMNSLLRGVGSVVSTAASLSTAGRGAFAELSSAAPGALAPSDPGRRRTGRNATWVTAQDDPRYVAPASLLEKRDRAAKQLDDLKEGYKRGGMSIEEYDRRRKQILEQL